MEREGDDQECRGGTADVTGNVDRGVDQNDHGGAGDDGLHCQMPQEERAVPEVAALGLSEQERRVACGAESKRNRKRNECAWHRAGEKSEREPKRGDGAVSDQNPGAPY